jgi:hypothetical protein
MKNRLLKSLSRLSVFVLFLFGAGEVLGQAQPMVIYDAGTATNNVFPFSNANSNRRSWIYSPANFTSPVPGFITKIYFVSSAVVSPVFTNLQINMGPTTFTSWPNANAWPTVGMTSVLSAATYSPTTFAYPGPSSGTWVAFELQTPYLWDGVTPFIVDAQQGGFNPGFTIRQAAVTNGSIYGNSATAPTATQNLLAVFGYDWIPAGPCVSPPVIGNAVASQNTVCVGGSTNLSVDSLSFGQGQTFQWQSSIDGLTWTNILNDTNASTSATILDTTFFRLGATCSGVTSYSTSVRVDAVGTPLPGGTYTVNSLLPTGGSNFTSLADFAISISCGGVSGPVILNVIQGTGPYTGQVIFDNINTSSVNTITINGNGEAIQYGLGTTGERATFWLKGTSHVTVNDLTIRVTTPSTFGYGVHLSEGASENTFNNCYIDIPISVTSANFSGIVLGSGSTPTAIAPNPPTNNTFEDCIVEGGYYGVTLIGGGNTAKAIGNKILNCTFRDFHFYGLYSHSQEDFEYTGNDFSRPTRSTLTSFYGMFFTNEHFGGIISKNAIHDPFVAANNTSVMYPFYSSIASASAAKPTYVYNNILYNLTNNGTLYGIWGSSTSHWKYYHNTIHIDDMNPTAGLTYAFYLSGTSDGVEFFNNIISMRRAGTSNKFALYVLGGGTRSINNNAYFVDYNVGTTNFGSTGTVFNTFPDWRTGNPNSWDANSVFDNPNFLFAPGGILVPASGAMDNIGQNLTAIVPTDYFDTVRTITPDPGAFEFQGPPCANPVSFDTTGVTSTTISLAWGAPGQTSSWDIEWGPVGFTPGTTGGNQITTSNNPYTITGLVPGNCYDIYIRANCTNLSQGLGPWVGPVNEICLPYDHDIAIDNLLSPATPTGCGDSAMAITFAIFNNGLQSEGNFPINVVLTGDFPQTFNYTYVGPIAPGNFDTVTVGTINTFAGGTMSVAITNGLTTDQNIVNDTLNANNVIIAPGAPVVNPAFACAGQDSLTLSVQPIPNITFNWFDVPTGGTSIAQGDSLRIASNTTSSFFVEYGAGSGAAGGDSLEFTFAAGNGQSGNMFDINALKALEVLGFTISPQISGPNTVEIWHRPGTYAGFENSNAGWTLIEAINYNSTGVPVRVDFSNSFSVTPGIHAFYVTIISGSVNYTNGTTVGAILNQNNDLILYEGIGKSHPFGATFSPRVFNGRIHYGMPGGACTSVRVPVPFTVHTDTAYADFTSTQVGPGTFNFDASNSTGQVFTWTFGDGATGSGVTTSHTYNRGDNFDVTLVVTDTVCNTIDSMTISVTSTVSLEEFLINQSLRVYPNPSRDVFHLEFNMEGVRDLYVRLLSPTGQVLYNQYQGKSAAQFKSTFDLSGHASGIYILQVQTDQGIVNRRLIRM